jgi:hypothetical protein
MSNQSLNPYLTPHEESRPHTYQASNVWTVIRWIANGAFVFAIVGPPTTFVCALAGIDIGLWDGLSSVIPIPFVLLLYLASSLIGIVAGFGSLLAVVVCVLFGRWWQRIGVVITWIAYILLVRLVVPLLGR